MTTFGTVKPYSPTEAIANQSSMIPDAVFTAMNRLLAKNALQSVINIRKDDLIEAIKAIDLDLQDDILYKNNWLDVEPAYRRMGWEVTYESPDWGSTGPGYYTFTRLKSSGNM